MTLSVRDLAEGVATRRIGFARGESWNRLGLGTELHANVLKKRCHSNQQYRSEVNLDGTFAVGNWKAIVTGRLDGCVQQEDGTWLIEEFKSAYSPSSHVRPSGENFELHRQQLLIYCHLWQQRGHCPVQGALVYVDIASGRELAFEIPYDPAIQQLEIETRLERLLTVAQSEAVVREEKRLLAVRLPFPHSSPRPGQSKLIGAVQATVRAGENLLAEAPTGSGKTAAGIHPALAEALATGKQLYFLTAKTLQQKMATDALIAMNQEGIFRTAQLRSKEKMCANDRVLCHEDFCPYARDYGEKMERSRLFERLRESQSHHDPGMVFEEAKREKVCPFEVQLELVARADAVVADYNYIFDPGVSLVPREELDNKILVVDEAHNLPDRARQIFSPELAEPLFQSALQQLTQQRPGRVPARTGRKRKDEAQSSLLLDEPVATSGPLFEEISETFSEVIAILQKTAETIPEKEAIAETPPPEKELRRIWKTWEARFINYLTWKRENKVAQVEDLIVDCHFALHKFLTTLTWFGPGFSCVVERNASGVRLALVCLDPARPLAATIESAASTVFLSATLSPLETTRRVLGIDSSRTRHCLLPPPFPKENRKLLILPQVRTTYGARERDFPRIAKLIAEMSEAVPGNVLVLFPSYAFLSRVAALFPQTTSRLLTQRPHVPDLERQEILSALSGKPAQKILLFAVLGGMYAEGIDYPGELLSGVFVVSPALPQVSFERELLRRYFDEQEQAGFAYAYLQPGMTRVIQAAGRLIRNETDRGVIALICQRFLQMPYTEFLPKDWFDETPAELIAQNPADQIKRFFEKHESMRSPAAEKNVTLPLNNSSNVLFNETR